MFTFTKSQTPRRTAPAKAAHGVPGWLVALLAVASGMTVANLYYAQPLLSSLSRVFHLSTTAAGGLVTLTQVGYVIGMLLLVPLGDRMEKRRLITVLLIVTTAALIMASLATSFPLLLIASLISGATSVVAQILVPFAANLAPDHARGRVVGRVMSGLLAGILLSRTISSLVSDLVGWRYVYLGSAVLMAVLALALRVALPQHAPTTALPYTHVLRSTIRLIRIHPHSCAGAVPGGHVGAFSAFWTTVSFVLTGPHLHYSSIGVAVFALVGAAGAAVAPLAGRWARPQARTSHDSDRLRRRGGGLRARGTRPAQHRPPGPRRHPDRHGRTDHADPRPAHHLPTRPQRAGTAQQRLHRDLLRRRALGSQLGSLAYHAAGWTAVTTLGAALPLIGLLYWTSELRTRRQSAH